MNQWEDDDGLVEVTSAWHGVTNSPGELTDDIHRRGWTVNKVHIKDGKYEAEAKNPHGEKVKATGKTEATALANLLMKVMRKEHIRSQASLIKAGAWDHQPIERELSKIAQAYAGAPVYEPKAAVAWMDLAQDFNRRAATIKGQIQVEYTDDPVPYEDSNELREDVTKKRKIVVTRAFAHHPVWSVNQILDYRLVVDVLGHVAAGGDWGWHGTCMAFAALAPLLSEDGQKALFTELLGQAAFGQFYRTWGPQKICFLDKEVEKLQEKENKGGHQPVHPSQSIVPSALPSILGAATTPTDPNADYETGVDPLPDAAYLWQRENGMDPLAYQSLSDALYPLETGLTRQHPAQAKQAVVNALRGSLMGSRNNAMGHAIHHQDLMAIPAEVDDPTAFWDHLENRRNQHNTGRGYPGNSHKDYWVEEQQFKQWVKAMNPGMDDAEVAHTAKRELLHMLTEEEHRILSADRGEQLPAEQIEQQAFIAVQRRLKSITKPNVDQKVDFGEQHLFHEATHHAGMYPPYLHSHMRGLAGIGRFANALTTAAHEDLMEHKGHGHHFRSTALSFGIPGLGPRQISHAWLHLAPQTSQLGVINPEIEEALGHNYETDMSNRDYFKHERELMAGRDASGYNHVPLGQFSLGMWDLHQGGPGWHPDRTAFKAISPTSHEQIDWATQTSPMIGWQKPYWWESTQPARDQVAQDFDRTIGTQHPKDAIPFKTASMPNRFYHVAPAEAESSILEQGLHGHEGDWGDTVWAWDHLPTAQTYAQPDDHIWEIDPTGLSFEPGGNPPSQHGGLAWSTGTIPPNRIRRVATAKTAASEGMYFHVAPTSERARIQQHGLIPADPRWNWKTFREGEYPPVGVYMFNDRDQTEHYRKTLDFRRGVPHDIWGIAHSGEVQQDRDLGGSAKFVTQPVAPQLIEGPEHRERMPEYMQRQYTIPSDPYQRGDWPLGQGEGRGDPYPQNDPEAWKQVVGRTAMQWDGQGNILPMYQLQPGEIAAPQNIPVRTPWAIHPQNGQRIAGTPGQSLAQHLKQTFNHPSITDVWNAEPEYQVGKDSSSSSTLAKVRTTTSTVVRTAAQNQEPAPPLSDQQYRNKHGHDWQTGMCDAYALALMREYPHLRLGGCGNSEMGIQHWWAHDDHHAYDSLGKHPLPYLGVNNQFDLQQLDVDPDFYGLPENGGPEDIAIAQEEIRRAQQQAQQKVANDPGLVNFYDLPHGLAGDPDLEQQLDAMYGENPQNYNFRLQQIPMSSIAYDGDPRTLKDYENSANDLEDGPRRVQIVRDHMARLQRGEQPIPLVVDRTWDDPNRYYLRDGYHRAAAAHTLGMTDHPAYVLEDQ